MSEAIAFDTHRFVKNLTESGFTEQQAEALAKEQIDLLNSNLATKVDIEGIKADLERFKTDLEASIERFKADLEASIATVKADLEVKIQESKVDLLKWMLTAMIAQGALVVTLVKLL